MINSHMAWKTDICCIFMEEAFAKPPSPHSVHMTCWNEQFIGNFLNFSQFLACIILISVIGRCVYLGAVCTDISPGKEEWIDSKTTLPTKRRKTATKLKTWSALCVFSCDSPLVGLEYGLRMDRQTWTPHNSVIIILLMDENKMRVCAFIFQQV